MNLYFLRHGPAASAGPDYPDDSLRPLSEDGRTKVRQIARAMKKLGLAFDQVYASPYKRTRETAEIVCKVLKLKLPVLLKPLEPGVNVSALTGKLEAGAKGENILLVGHEPDMTRLMTLFVTGHNGSVMHMPPGGLGLVAVERLQAGRCGVLEWLFDPDHLAVLGGED